MQHCEMENLTPIHYDSFDNGWKRKESEFISLIYYFILQKKFVMRLLHNITITFYYKITIITFIFCVGEEERKAKNHDIWSFADRKNALNYL